MTWKPEAPTDGSAAPAARGAPEAIAPLLGTFLNVRPGAPAGVALAVFMGLPVRLHVAAPTTLDDG